MPYGPQQPTLALISPHPTLPCQTYIQPLGATYEDHEEGHRTPWCEMKWSENPVCENGEDVEIQCAYNEHDGVLLFALE